MSRTADRTLDARSITTLPDAGRLFASLPSPRIIGAQLAVFVGVRLALGGWRWADLAVVAAIAAYWPLQEWFLHQTLLHWKPRRLGRWTVDPLAARLHRSHHREPWRVETTILASGAVIVMTPVHILFWWLVLPTPRLAVTAMAAYSAAALVYEWTHYLVHTNVKPRWFWFRRVWLYHRLHHFKNERYWHGFTVPWVDDLLGTAPDPDTVDKSPTVRTLGVTFDPAAESR